MGHYGPRYGILPGAFNPVTEAHVAMAVAALAAVDQVIFVLPRKLPHKDYSGVPFATRLFLLHKVVDLEPRFLVAETDGGLFIEIARELRARLPPNADLHFLCGRDAAERIANWDYGAATSFERMLEEFGLLVAPREGSYQIQPRHAARIAHLPLAEIYQAISATEVRQCIRDGSPWRHLVPAAIRPLVAALYEGGTAPKTA